VGQTVQLRNMTGTVVYVTPDMAFEWLENNQCNRPLRHNLIDKYARDMKNGKWRLNGESIIRTRKGELYDGQHRLWAIVETAMTIAIFVVTGDLDRDDQAVMDSGGNRGAADNLHMGGVKNSKLVSALARLAIMYDVTGNLNRGYSPTHSEIYEWIDEHSIEAELAAGTAARYKSHLHCAPSMIALSTYLIGRETDDWEGVDDFWRAAATKVGLAAGDPVLALEKRFGDDRIARITPVPQAQLSAIVRAWNYRRAGKKLAMVKYESPGEKDRWVPVPAIAS
jgi:hypothetical protein